MRTRGIQPVCLPVSMFLSYLLLHLLIDVPPRGITRYDQFETLDNGHFLNGGRKEFEARILCFHVVSRSLFWGSRSCCKSNSLGLRASALVRKDLQKTLKFVGPGYGTCCCPARSLPHLLFPLVSLSVFCLLAPCLNTRATSLFKLEHLYQSENSPLRLLCLVPQYMSLVFFVASLVARQRTRCFLSAPSPRWHRKLQHTTFNHTHDISELLSAFLVVPCLSNMSIHDCQS